MLMKYFTFTSICLLTFCMFLALSGTADLPDDYAKHLHGPKPDIQVPLETKQETKGGIGIPESNDVAKKQLTATASSLQHRERQVVSQEYHRRIVSMIVISLFGIGLLVVWIFLSLKLLSVDLPNKPES